MAWQGIEVELTVPCAENRRHPVRLRVTGWGEYTVVHNPCEELLGRAFSRMAPCTRHLQEEFLQHFQRDTQLRRQLAEALAAAGKPAVPHLIRALGDWDSAVRAAACQALGSIGDAQAVPHLIRALEDQDSDVRAAACQALVGIGRAAVPALIEALGYHDSRVRAAACQALGSIGDIHAHPALSLWAHAGEAAAQDALHTLGRPRLPLHKALVQLSLQGAWRVLVRALPAFTTKLRRRWSSLG